MELIQVFVTINFLQYFCSFSLNRSWFLGVRLFAIFWQNLVKQISAYALFKK